jgi:hypothetical protein
VADGVHADRKTSTLQDCWGLGVKPTTSRWRNLDVSKRQRTSADCSRRWRPWAWKMNEAKLRWVDNEADLKTVGVRGLRRKALDRDEWKGCARGAKARRGL